MLTPIFLEINDKKVLSVIGEKEINAKSFNKIKTRITVILTILGNGISLKTFYNFQWET